MLTLINVWEWKVKVKKILIRYWYRYGNKGMGIKQNIR